MTYYKKIWYNDFIYAEFNYNDNWNYYISVSYTNIYHPNTICGWTIYIHTTDLLKIEKIILDYANNDIEHIRELFPFWFDNEQLTLF